MQPALNEPRPRDYHLDQLAHLGALRDRTRGEVLDRLHLIDSITRRMDGHLDQLGADPTP